MFCSKFKEDLQQQFAVNPGSEHKFKSKSLIERAMKNLQQRNHVEFLVKVGKFNFNNNIVDEGRRIFEAVLTGYPKRIDVYSAYIDLETKYSIKDERALHIIRAILSRAVECGAG